jgi:RNA polymerase sporulation-specific sigma factor
MVQGKVEICGVNTAKLPLLKAADKEALFAKIREGDTAARETYIEGNLRLVLSVIKRFSGSAENVDDLFQIGCIGLIKAIDNFDSTLGVKFSTYAVPMIIGEIRRFLRDNNSIRVSRSLKDTAYKAIYARDTLTRKNLKEPTMEEIAAEVGISKEDIVYALDAMQNPMSLYEPVYTDGGDTLDVLKPGLDVQRSIVGDVGHHDVGRAVGDEVVIHHGQALAGLGGVGQVGRDVVLDLDPARGDGTENQRKYV